MCDINYLPEELLEKILSYLSPYRDFYNARLVSKLWNRVINGIVQQKITNFSSRLRTSNFKWKLVDLSKSDARISERYSHCACYHDKSLYVFGGCTSTNTNTTFNDLWRYDLDTEHWIRPLAMGTYPSPKACASLVSYKNVLILFGGWAHPSPYPLHQAALFFNELHIYRPERNRWISVQTSVSPPPTAGHSVSIIDDYMLVFGGCQSPGTGCNDIWVYDLILSEWCLAETTANKPNGRYGQSQCSVNRCILIVGGCGGPNRIFSDLWLLDTSTDVWTWFEIEVNGLDYSPPQLWCHQACKVGESVVVVRKPSSIMQTKLDADKMMYQNKLEIQRSKHSSYKHGKLKPHKDFCSTSEKSRKPLSNEDNKIDMACSSDILRNDKCPLVRDFTLNLNCDNSAQIQCTLTSKLSPHYVNPNGVDVSPDHPNGPSCSQNSGVNDHTSESTERPCKKLTITGLREQRKMRSPFSRNRQKQLEMLQKYSDRIRQLSNNAQNNAVGEVLPLSPTMSDSIKENRTSTCLHVLDISQTLLYHTASWLPATYPIPLNSPDETVFYSLTLARGELLLFGGMHRDLPCLSPGSIRGNTINSDSQPHIITNALYRIY